MVYKKRPKQQTSKVSLYTKRESQAADLKGQVQFQQGSSKIDYESYEDKSLRRHLKKG